MVAFIATKGCLNRATNNGWLLPSSQQLPPQPMVALLRQLMVATVGKYALGTSVSIVKFTIDTDGITIDTDGIYYRYG